MTSIALVVLTATVLLGMYLGLLYMQGRRRLLLVSLHLLLGVGGMLAFVLLLRATPDADATNGPLAALLLALAAFSGAGATLLRRSPMAVNMVLSTHAGIAALGFALALAWLVAP